MSRDAAPFFGVLGDEGEDLPLGHHSSPGAPTFVLGAVLHVVSRKCGARREKGLSTASCLIAGERTPCGAVMPRPVGGTLRRMSSRVAEWRRGRRGRAPSSETSEEG